MGRLGAALRLGAAAALALASPAFADDPAGKPGRVVSLNLCTDELLLRLVSPDRIASVTWLSRDPRSGNLAEAAREMPAGGGTAEEVLAARPDLVLAGRYTTRNTVALLRRAGIPVVEVEQPSSLDGVRDAIRRVAEAVGEPARGAALVAAIDARLARLSARPSAGTPSPGATGRPVALVLGPNGFTAGPGTLLDAILERAGLDNGADRLALGGTGQVPLEAVVASGADLLVVDAEPDGPPSLATDYLRHPALRALARRIRTARIPSRLWGCPGPGVAEAAERFAAAAAARAEGDAPGGGGAP